jgi:type I restriction enzyme S subunit
MNETSLDSRQASRQRSGSESNSPDLLFGWKTKRLGEVVDIYDKRRIPLSETKRQGMKGDYPYCGANGVLDHINNYLFEGEFILLAEDGGHWGAFEKSAYIMNAKFWVNNHAHVLQAKAGLADNQFIAYLLNYLNLNPFIMGTTRGKLNQGTMANMLIPVPPYDRQLTIAKALQRVKIAIESREQEIRLERERKAALMEHLFTHGTQREPTKQTEIGEMPSSWDVTTPQVLLDTEIIADIQDGNHGERHPKQSDFQRSGIPFLTADCIREGKIDFHHAKYLDESWLDKLRVGFAKPGDVLLTHKGTVGETSIVNERHDVVILSPQVTYYRIKNSERLYHKYLFAVFQSSVFRSQLKRLASTQRTRAYVGITKQKNIKIPLPKFAEQVKIATVLSACDKKSTALDGESALLAELFQALLEGLMTGRLPTNALFEAERHE